MATRTNSARKTKTAAAAQQVFDADGVEVKPNDQRTWSYEALKAKLNGMEMSPATKRILGFAVFLVTFGSTYYVGMQMTIALATLVAGLTLSAFLTFMVLFLGQVISLILGLFSAAKAQQFVMEDGYKTILAAPSKIAGWFGRVRNAAEAV